jgi:oligoribonuclease
MSSTPDTRLIWIDLEMTGLDTDNDQIIEVATIVTDDNLNILAEGPITARASWCSTYWWTCAAAS